MFSKKVSDVIFSVKEYYKAELYGYREKLMRKKRIISEKTDLSRSKKEKNPPRC